MSRAGYLQTAYGCLLQAGAYNLPEMFVEKAKWLWEKVKVLNNFTRKASLFKKKKIYMLWRMNDKFINSFVYDLDLPNFAPISHFSQTIF